MAEPEKFPDLSERQTKALRFVIEFSDANGAPPSWGETAAHLGMNTRNPDVFNQLITRGFLTKLPVRNRKIGVSPLGRAWYKQLLSREPQGRFL